MNNELVEAKTQQEQQQEPGSTLQMPTTNIDVNGSPNIGSDLNPNIGSNSKPNISEKQPLILFYYPNTINSRKVLLALESRQIPYQGRLIDVHKGEHLEPWFLAIAPRGELPVLKHGETIFTDISSMFQYLDSTFISDPKERLIPTGSDVAASRDLESLREEIEGINMPLITYGALFHANLVNDVTLVEEERIKKVEAIKNAQRQMRDLSVNFPDCSALYSKKESRYAKFIQRIENEDAVKHELNRVEQTLEQVEGVMKTKNLSDTVNANEKRVQFLGLYGNVMTAADISLLGLINSIYRAGMGKKFIDNAQNRPNILRYWKNVVTTAPFDGILLTNPVVPIKEDVGTTSVENNPSQPNEMITTVAAAAVSNVSCSKTTANENEANKKTDVEKTAATNLVNERNIVSPAADVTENIPFPQTSTERFPQHSQHALAVSER